MIKSNETIDDLQIANLKIIQKEGSFKFGTDAVLLSDFAKDIKSQNTLDLCTGSGIVPILMSAKTKTAHFCAMEIQKEIADMTKRSVDLNGLGERIKVECRDLRDALSIYPKRSFDLITCNPPYIKENSAILNQNDEKIIARHEVCCNLEDIVSISSKLLTTTGHLVMVHRPTRLTDMIYLMQKYDLAPKKIRFVHKSKDTEPVLVLCDALYKGRSDVRILPPLFLCDEEGKESEELIKIYNRGE